MSEYCPMCLGFESEIRRLNEKLAASERENAAWRALGEMYVFGCDRGLLDTKAARDQFAALLGMGPAGMRNKAGG
jgi:hypothetical protein